MSKSKILLHICCAPCASHPVMALKDEYDITMLFYGPNIHPVDEYKKRLDSVYMLAKILGIKLVELEYNTKIWFDAVKGLEDEPEGGSRCAICHRIRLERTARFARDNDYPIIATSLTTSPYKPARVINPIGEELAGNYGINFLDRDFKKQDGYRKSCELSRKYGLYRQNYCGCVYSQ